ncbi:hypothetical protein [Methylorubrum thiocyanatum]|uniref:hypothetical protein n=1 Tax=Methylorubrum thiocyanatum TaxID=47958 RepID=UPI0036683AC6
MSNDDLLWYANLANSIAISSALVASFWLWRLTLKQEAGIDHPHLRRLAGRLQFTFMALAAGATFALWQYSLAATKEADARIVEAGSTAGKALKEAGDANERAAVAEKQAAEFSLIIERLRQGRMLSDGAKIFVSQACARFPGINFDLAANPGDQESRDFMISLANILVESGWSAKTYSGNTIKYGLTNGIQFGEVTVSGLVFLIHKSNENDFRPAAEALRDALNQFGIKARIAVEDWRKLQQGGSDLSTDVLHIHVGKDTI